MPDSTEPKKRSYRVITFGLSKDPVTSLGGITVLPSVAEGGIITANPFGFVEFAAEIIRALDVFPPEYLEFWVRTIKTGYLNVDSVDPTAGKMNE